MPVLVLRVVKLHQESLAQRNMDVVGRCCSGWINATLSTISTSEHLCATTLTFTFLVSLSLSVFQALITGQYKVRYTVFATREGGGSRVGAIEKTTRAMHMLLPEGRQVKTVWGGEPALRHKELS